MVFAPAAACVNAHHTAIVTSTPKAPQAGPVQRDPVRRGGRAGAGPAGPVPAGAPRAASSRSVGDAGVSCGAGCGALMR